MRNWYVFTKKELLESWRTSRFWLLLVIYLIFGVMNPLFAKFMPEILKLAGGESFILNLPPPTSLDSWTQFYKNVSQLGLFVVVLVYSGCVSNEVSKGTLVNLVTKGLERNIIILAKATSLFLQWTLYLSICFLVTWGYTAYYFPDTKSPHLFVAVLPLWLFGLFLLCLTLLFSAVARNNYEGLLMTGGVIGLLLALALFPQAENYNPLSLATENLAFLQGTSPLSDFMPAILLTLFAGIVCLLLALLVMNRKKL